MKKKSTPASPAVALASKVLPVPGGPVRRTPFGSLPPRASYFVGSLRKSTISSSSARASSQPWTSSNLTLVFATSTDLSATSEFLSRVVFSVTYLKTSERPYVRRPKKTIHLTHLEMMVKVDSETMTWRGSFLDP